MSDVVLYFHVHQPFRIRKYDMFRIGSQGQYFDATHTERLNNKKIFHKVARKCYYPANQLLYELLRDYPDFKISFSITGVFIEQMQRYEPDLIDSFQRLIDTGKVEIVSETYYHSLAALYSKNEFFHQVHQHQKTITELFGVTPTAFRNTELIYNNHIAKLAEEMGFQAILAEGVDRYLGWRSPNFVYTPTGTENIRLMLKNYKLSDDIAFRFSSQEWKEWPLTADKFAHWISAINGNGQVVNLFMDYETIGEHQWEDTGIFHFLRSLPGKLKQHPDNSFATITEAATKHQPLDEVDMPHLTSWADMERDISAWLSNPMQYQAMDALFELEDDIKSTKNDDLIQDWRRLTTSDHFYYMCTKWFADGDVHKYFSPNTTPYEAYVHFMNVLHDLRMRVYAK